MKKVNFIFLLIVSLSVFAQNSYFNKHIDWQEELNTSTSIVPNEDGFLLLQISFGTNFSFREYILTQLDNKGNIVWQKNSDDGLEYLGGHIILLKNNNLCMFLTSYEEYAEGEFNGQYYLTKINESGDVTWSHTYGLGILSDASRKVTQTYDLGFILTGFSKNFPDELGQAYIVKTDSLGNLEWQNAYGRLDGHDQGTEVIQTEDGGYLVMGWTSIQNSNRDVWLFKIDSLGNMLWEKKYGSWFFEECKDILEVKDGYVLVGYQYQSPMLDEDARGYILKIDKEGNLLWEKTYTGVSEYYGTRLDDIFWEVRELEDGNLAVIGNSRNYNELERFSGTLMKLTAEGDSLWTKVYSNSISTHQFWDFEVTEDNGFVICGFTASGVESGNQDAWVLKLDSLGNTCQPANCDSIFTTSIHYDISTHYPTRFYPNPAKNQVTFEHRLTKDAVLEVYDLKGRIIEVRTLFANERKLGLVLDIEAWKSGLYLYRVSIEGKEVSSGKVLCR